MRQIQLRSRLQGAMCGTIWMPAVPALVGVDVPMRGPFGIWQEGDTFRAALLSYLMGHGGDFQNAKFTGDTVIFLERMVWNSGKSKARTLTRFMQVKDIPGCEDLVDVNVLSCDLCEEAA